MLDSLHRKFLLNFCIFGLMASIGISSMIYIFMRERVVNQLKDNLNVYSNFSSELVLNRNEIIFTYLEGMAHEQVLRDQNTNLIEKLRLINMIGEGNKYFEQLGIILPNGYLYTIDIEKGDIKFSDVKDTEYFKHTIRGNRSIMNPDYIKNIEEQESLSVLYSVPIIEASNIVGGIVGISSSDFLYDLVKDISYGKSGYTFIVGKDGYLLAHPYLKLVESKTNILHENKNFMEYNDFFRFVEGALESSGGAGNYKYRGRDYYSTYKK